MNGLKWIFIDGRNAEHLCDFGKVVIELMKQLKDG